MKEKWAEALEKLGLWYAVHGRRDLPWRQSRDPYEILVSETMLQQTQVKTVLERYYHPFLRKFPTLVALAEASREEVLKAWEGMGYYRRAKHLHEAAQRAGTQLPETVEALLELPGIGRNTAHAVAAFAWNHPVPVMEANLRRVLHRLTAAESMSEKALWALAETLLNRADPFTYNQAMMDIGAMICTPRVPDCLACPLNAACRGKENPEAYPAPKARKKKPVRRKLLLALQNAKGEFYLSQRPGPFLSGLFGFPEFDIEKTGERKHWLNLDSTTMRVAAKKPWACGSS